MSGIKENFIKRINCIHFSFQMNQTSQLHRKHNKCVNLVHECLIHNNFPITAISCHECSQVNTLCIGLPVFLMRFSLIT